MNAAQTADVPSVFTYDAPATADSIHDNTDVYATHECPVCAAHIDPITGNPRYNAETVAAIEEGIAISRGEIPAKRFHSFEEMWKDLEKDDPDD